MTDFFRYLWLAGAVWMCVWIEEKFDGSARRHEGVFHHLRARAGALTMFVVLMAAVPVILLSFSLHRADVVLGSVLAWGAVLFFLELFFRIMSGAKLLLSAFAAVALLLLAEISGDLAWCNTVLLAAASAGTVSLLLRRYHISRDALLLLLAFAALLDVLFVWVIPDASNIVERSEPLHFALLFAVGSLSLGVGDIVALLLLARILKNNNQQSLTAGWVAFIALTVMAVFVLDATGVFISNSFPFLLVVLPFAYAGVTIRAAQAKKQMLTSA